MPTFHRRCSLVALIVLAGLLAACATQPPPVKTIRIGVATFSHETCTFCPEPTGVAEWEFYGPPQRGDAVLEDGGYIGGFVKQARQFDHIELVGALSPRGARGGSSGSWITQEAFDKYSNGIAEDLKANMPLDGVYLALHGAMAVTGVPKPEAEIARRVRAAVGDIPIVATFDLHANEDHEFLDAADGAFIVKRYPHYDSALQGERAARYLLRVIKGEYKPAKATRKPGVITPSVFQGTGVSPAMEIMERARIWEERAPDVFVSVAFGFAYADVADVGATVEVMTNGNQALADEIAQDMSDFIWMKREAFAGKKLPKVKDGVAEAVAAARAGKTPVVVADHSDRTGNSTWILEELIRQGGKNFVVATISDDKAIEVLKAGAKVGDQVSVEVGGYADEHARVPGQVRAARDDGGRPVRRQQPRDRDAGARPGDRRGHPGRPEDRPSERGHDRHQVARALLARVRGERTRQGGRRHRRAGPGPGRPERDPVPERAGGRPLSARQEGMMAPAATSRQVRRCVAGLGDGHQILKM